MPSSAKQSTSETPTQTKEDLKPVDNDPNTWLYVSKSNPEYAEYKAPPLETTGQRILANVITFVLVHYLFWGSVCALLLYGLYLTLPQIYGIPTCLTILALYFWKFFDKSESKLGKPWHWLRRGGYWKWVHRYANLRVVRKAKLDPEKPYVFSLHPHGILILSRIASYGGIFEKLFPGIEWRCLGATPIFYVPLCRDFSLWMGAVDAGRKTAHRVLDSGRSIMVYPGGTREIFMTSPNSPKEQIVLKERKGFVKLALAHGADLVPSVVLGEHKCYSRYFFPSWLKQWFLRYLKMPLLMFWGKFGTLMPHDCNLTVIYGEPIPVEKNTSPTDEEIDELHSKYISALKSLHSEYAPSHPDSYFQELEIS